MIIKVGLVGCGGITKPHIAGYLQIPEQVTVSAVSDIVTENAEARAREVGGAAIFSDYHQMIQQADIDVVDICLLYHLHADAIVTAANAGKHILCEKPLCLTVEEANRVQQAVADKQAVADNGVTLMCAHNQLMLPAVSMARKLLQEGLLGKVYEIRITDSFYNRFNPDSMGWRAQRSYIGGGELIDTGYHPTYLLLYLAGSEPVEVTAMLSKHRLEFMDGEDSAQVLVRFANGSVGNIVTSWVYVPTPIMEKFSIVGEKGYMYSTGKDLVYKLQDSEPQTIELESVNTIPAEIVEFIGCLREKRWPLNT